jgi:signal transduction histidine kinase
MIVPLRARGLLIGTLDFSRHQPSRYSLADVETAQYCADFIAPYIHALIQSGEARRALLAESEARNREEVLRVGASRLAEGMERERRRIAMDLHDQTLADLARVARDVAALNARGTASGAQLAVLHREIVVCLTELRRIVDDMRPAVLELFGLRDAIEAHLTRAAAGAEPPISTSIEDKSEGAAERLAPEMRTALYRIIQEAINNAVRHGRPAQVCVRMESRHRALRIEVSDDGVGYSGSDPDAVGGIGHMRTRASLIGAQLRIGRPRQHGGTRVVLDLPWPEEDSASASGRRTTAALGGV